MAEEFQESEVIFQENAQDDDDHYHDHRYNFSGQLNSVKELRNNTKLKRKKKSKKKNSVPVNIPENNYSINASSTNNSIFQYVDSDFFEEEYYDEEGQITPPHVILGRRVAGKMAFSVCTGNGRTLKGRDLSQVRNSILRMTGFLET